MSRALIVGVALLVACGITSPVLAQQDPHFGTWKLNVMKSTTNKAAPKDAIRTYEPFEGDGVRLTSVTVDGHGKRTTGGFSAHFDGKEYSATGDITYDTMVLKRIDPYTWESTMKKRGKFVETVTNVVSQDGKTMTTTATSAKGKGAGGKPVDRIGVWEKQ